MIKNKFLYYKTKAEFEKDMNGGEVKDSSIAFLEDTREIWSHGEYYKCLPQVGGEGSGIDADLLRGKTPEELNVGSADKLDIKKITGVDLNKIIEDGFYYKAYNDTTILNQPGEVKNYSFNLQVYNRDKYITQVIYFTNPTNKEPSIMIRNYHDDGWTDWKRIVNESELGDYVKKVPGKDLSTNDFTDLYKHNIDHLCETIDEKANTRDLSNVVIADEVIEGPLKEEIDLLTRDTIKKDLFIDLWNSACGSYGSYNEETGFFELNGLTDITFQQAIEIYNVKCVSLNPQVLSNYWHHNKNIRTNILTVDSLGVSAYNYSFNDCSNLEVARANMMNSGTRAFEGCTSLKRIIGFYGLELGSNWDRTFSGCVNLETIDGYGSDTGFRLVSNIVPLGKSINLSYCPKLGISVFNKLVNSVSGSCTNTLTLLVHSNIYNKLIDESNTEWFNLFNSALNKNISFAIV